MIKPLDAVCEFCKWGVLEKLSSPAKGDGVRCYRFPPQIGNGMLPRASFPLTAPGDWCGEFEEEK